MILFQPVKIQKLPFWPCRWLLPLKLTTGALTSAPQPGAIEYDGNNLYVTLSSGIRYPIPLNGNTPELTATLTPNMVNNVAIGDKTLHRSIQLNYTLSRGTGYRQGVMQILEGGTASPWLTEDYQFTADLGITFNAAYDSVSNNVINLVCTVNNQDANTLQLKYKLLVISMP